MPQPSETLFVTLVQADLKWADAKGNLQMFEEMIMSSKDKMELVVLPEMFSTGFVIRPQALAEDMNGPTVQWMKRIAAEKKIVLAGSVIIKEEDKYFNRMIWMLPNGTYGVYDKRHLFAYAGEDESFSSGNKRLIASLKGWKINLQVCYDLRFPVWARQSLPLQAGAEWQPGVPEYDVLIYVANWPQRRSHAWKTLLQARAIENQSYVVGVNRVGTDGEGLVYNGDSMVVDAMGEIERTESGSVNIFTCELSYSKLQHVRERLPFLRVADPFIIGNLQP
jgi:omega-amidase